MGLFTARKRKLSNVDEAPAQATKKKKTATKTSEQGKEKASKRTGKALRPKRGKKTYVFILPLPRLLTPHFQAKNVRYASLRGRRR